jgi:hypothetical protein
MPNGILHTLANQVYSEEKDVHLLLRYVVLADLSICRAFFRRPT